MPQRWKTIPDYLACQAPNHAESDVSLWATTFRASALRLGEVDAKRGMLFINQAKGPKDRIMPISKNILEMLRTNNKIIITKGAHSQAILVGDIHQGCTCKQVGGN